MPLTNLRSLTLEKCKKCKQIPPLGKLSSLEKLMIWGLKSVKRVANEFLGIESDNDSSLSSSVIAFPKLKSLTFYWMEELEEWDYGITGMGSTSIMPCLSYLAIISCPKLKALPDHFHQMTTLKEQYILGCGIPGVRFRNGKQEDLISQRANVYSREYDLPRVIWTLICSFMSVIKWMKPRWLW